MLIKQPDDILSAEITPESIYQERRRFMRTGVNLMIATTVGVTNTTLFSAPVVAKGVDPSSTVNLPIDFPHLKPSAFSTEEQSTPVAKITAYANFYEFGTDKSDPQRYAQTLTTRPWSVQVVGEVEKPGVIDMEEILRKFTLEERIYRLRCVEGWSMVIPWVGLPLSELIKRFQPTSKAKYVQFFSLLDPKQMPGQEDRFLNWPYTEGLRIDEAMHPLTILSVGLYGRVLPHENGAPLRLVVPWKYGFKSIKSIVKMRFMEQEPLTSWIEADPRAYGFYANVNPAVPHPRWSQKKERRIGEFFKRNTLMFNGYAEQVSSLYTDMDLRKYY
jgi:sulfoxide reductase catalytic subunit YedY